jgi:hypothetical protein
VKHDKDADIATKDEGKTIKQNNSNSSGNKNLRFVEGYRSAI